MSTIKTRITDTSRTKLTAAALIGVLVVGGSAYGVIRHNHVSGKTMQEQVIAKVQKHMYLPTNESPTLATVTDAAKISKTSFLAKAKNGDKVLLYPKNQREIIYRPSADRIVDVGPVVTGTSSSPYVTSKVAILNGSGNPQSMQNVVTKLFAKFPNVTVVSKDVAPRDFPTTIVVDMTKKNQPLAEQLADSLGYKAGRLPLGIVLPTDSDMLIIIGADQQ